MGTKTSADVIVIGVGGMGSSTCYQLAKRGLSVIGLEQFDHGHSLGSSHGQTRIIRKAYFEHPNYVPLLKRAYEIWRELENDAQRRLYHETGIVYFCPPKSQLLAGLKMSAEKYKIRVDQLSDSQVQKYEGLFSPDESQSCVFEPEAGFLEVDECVKQFGATATRLGAHLVSNTHVLSWRSEKGKVFVKTNDQEYSAKNLVITAGPWTSQILKDERLPLHILKKMLIWLPAVEAYHEDKNAPCFFLKSPTAFSTAFRSLVKIKRSR